MPDLQEGESIQVQGSAKRPYEIKNYAGIYSCSCPAWRNQSRHNLLRYRMNRASGLSLSGNRSAKQTSMRACTN